MKVELREIAAVQMGYSFRSRVEVSEGGDIVVIQMKDLTDWGVVDAAGLVRVNLEGLKEHHLAKCGDLVFRSRGLAATSAILREDLGQAVVAAPLLRIRSNPEIILPEYLNWLINQPVAQAYLASRAKGTAMKMISKQALEGIEMMLPPLDRQRAIIDLVVLAEKEQALMAKLAHRRKQTISRKLMQLAQGE